MSLYPYALFLHVVGLLALFIAIGLEWLTALRMRAAQSTVQVREWGRVSNANDKVFPISSILILAAGLYMTFAVWGFSHAWIDVSLVELIVMSALGPTIAGRRLKAIHSAVETMSDGPLPASLQRAIDDPLLWMYMQITPMIALGIVCLMTVKPDWIGALAVAIAFPVVGFIIGRLTLRPHAVQGSESLANADVEKANVL